MKEVLVIFLITLIHGNDGGIYVEGPSEPVAEGTEVTLQCMSTDPGTDLSQVHLRQLWGKDHWYVVDEGRHGVGYIRLLGNQMNFTMESAWTGTYACVSNNDISPDNSSQPLTLGLQFLLTPNILRRGSPDRALSDPSGESGVTVREGEDVVMDCHSNSSGTPEYYWSRRDDDWIVPSSTLYLRKMQAAEEGQYTCMAQLPGDSLSRSHKVYISVRPGTFRRLQEECRRSPRWF
ncbi:hypothetical protein NHX12_002056 [Muraenolepis orangiensis]|uniref:Ig-like domain-containing protein n=1 Tax=Muraenolepis orangiensis TaxID=630683 RepID=A0A9Q0E5T2_9TELE|nr:hypothetical protein NHX12_002056 [Muraenolepis orangiensis]